MSVSDGKPLTREEQIELFREKEVLLFWFNFLLLHYGTPPEKLFELMEKRILDMKNSSGEEFGSAEHVWNFAAYDSVPVIEKIAGQIRAKLTAP